MSESPWTPGYSEELDATILPEMPYIDVGSFVAIGKALTLLKNILNEVASFTNALLTTDVWLPLPSGLLVKVLSKSGNSFVPVDFVIPSYDRKIVHFNVLSLRYSAHLYPGQNKWANLIYVPKTLVITAYASFGTTLAWSDSSTRDYTIQDLAIDAAGLTLLSSFITFLVYKGFSQLSQLDVLLHSKVDALSSDVSANAAIDTEQLERIKRLYAGSYV